MKPNHALFIWHFMLALCIYGDATLINRTIDDKFGDSAAGRVITYSPAGAWKDGTVCKNCAEHPDPNQLFKHTWTDSTFGVPVDGIAPNTVFTASVMFNGTAVYVVCALNHRIVGPYTRYDMYFFIDNRLAGTFSQEAPGTTGYDYNVTVFTIAGLPPMEHNITIQNGHVGGPRSLMLLDAIIYTQDSGEPAPERSSTTTITSTITRSSSSSSPPPLHATTILAIALGSVSCVGLGVIAFFLYRRFCQPSDAFQCTPYTYNPSVSEIRVHEGEAPPSHYVVPDTISTPRCSRKTDRR